MEGTDTSQSPNVGAVSKATLEIGSCTNILRECRSGPPVCRWSDTRSISRRRRKRAAACGWVSSKGAGLSASQPHLACSKHVGPFAAIGLNFGGFMQARADPISTVGTQRIQTGDGKHLVWDGKSFQVIDDRKAAIQSLPLPQRIEASVQQCQAKLRRAFLPDESSVTEDYWPYAKWRAGQRVFTSMLGILATQSMLEAVGVGAKRSLPVAATLNWVLKDGLGKLGKISVAAAFGRGFDADLKACRFRSSVLYEACIFLELLTPYFPHHFLALATTAKVGMSMAYTTHVATQPAFNKSFSKGEHMAEISAKTQAQQTAAETVGLALVVLIRTVIRNNANLNRALPLMVFPICAFGDIFSISKELKAVELKTINMQRGEIIAKHWVTDREAPTPGQVSREERIFLPFLEAAVIGRRLPLDLTPVPKLASDPEELEQLLGLYKAENYMLNFHTQGGAPGAESSSVADLSRTKLSASLRPNASPADLFLLVLQAAHLRRLCSSASGGEGSKETVLKQSLAAARQEIKPFVQGMQDKGWLVGGFMVSSDEKDTCTFVPVK